jgi:hypothetical protein
LDNTAEKLIKSKKALIQNVSKRRVLSFESIGEITHLSKLRNIVWTNSLKERHRGDPGSRLDAGS